MNKINKTSPTSSEAFKCSIKYKTVSICSHNIAYIKGVGPEIVGTKGLRLFALTLSKSFSQI